MKAQISLLSDSLIQTCQYCKGFHNFVKDKEKKKVAVDTWHVVQMFITWFHL